MSAPDLTAETMDRFRQSGAEAHSTILLGAGASTTSGLPDWDTLATRLLLQSGAVRTEETASLLVARQDPLLVVEAARVAFGDKWARKLRAALYDGVKSMDPSPLHLAAVGHLLGGNGADASLVTLNFDTLLEQAIAVETGMAAHSSTDGQVDGPQGHGPHSVFHLHGVITPQLSESVVLTLTDFTDLIADSNSWQSRYLQEAVGRGALVIAGTSYRDPDLRQWLRIALEQKPAEHSALVLLAREGFALSKAQFIEIQRALYDQWSAVGLHPVLLQDHSDAAQIIRELRSVHSPGYRAPQQRALDVWNSHVDRFDEMQEQYVDQLEADAEIMRDALGVDDLNLTLWLANGAGQLARWAAQDRIYRDVSALRMVETGHDSPWIAGQALGRDSMLLEDLDSEGTGRWRCVLALPVPVPHPWLPTLSTAVLTIGMAEPIDDIEGLRLMWEEPLAEIADRWGDRLSVLAFSDDPRRLPDTHDEEA